MSRSAQPLPLAFGGASGRGIGIAPILWDVVAWKLAGCWVDKITMLALQAIVHGLHRGGTITTASVADIVVQLQEAAVIRHEDALDAEGARQLMALANGIEADATDV